MLWAFMWVAYLTEKALDITEDSLEEFVLEMVVLPLGTPIWVSSETALNLKGLDIAEIKGILPYKMVVWKKEAMIATLFI